MVTHDAVVVGGGVSGLVAALDLSDAGRNVLLLEAGGMLGGSVARGRVGSLEAELGADAFARARPEIPALAARLGIDSDIVAPRVYQAYLRSDGTNVALPPSLMGIPVSYDAIRALLGDTVANDAKRRDEAPLEATLPESFGALVRQRLGDTVVEQMVDPVVSGVHASRADTVETASILPGFAQHLRTHGSLVATAKALRGSLGPAGAPVAGFRHGMSQLIDALHANCVAAGVSVQTNTPVTAVTRQGTLWQIDTAKQQFVTPLAVVSLPAKDAKQLLAGTQPFAATLADSLATFTTTDVTLVALHVHIEALSATATPLGSGVLVTPGQHDVRAKALTHVSAKWDAVLAKMGPQEHLFRLSYGGTEPVPSNDQDTLVGFAISDLAALLAIPVASITVRAARVITWQGALTRPHVGRMAAVGALDATLGTVDDLALIGNAYAGNGLAGVVGRARREVSRILKA